MEDRETALNELRLAEQQFRLACTVHVAVANGLQTLDVPVEWTFGRHRVSYADLGLRPDQADLAASLLENTALFVLVGAVRTALLRFFNDPKSSQNIDVASAYQISRLLRNAFSHSMIHPKWSIDKDCEKTRYVIGDVISLDTYNLHGQPVNWRHYGGPLAIFYFGRFVRETLLRDPVDPQRKQPEYPRLECYQQGRLVLKRVNELPCVEIPRAARGKARRWRWPFH